MDPESQESGLNGDGDKQILAPAEGPRENLIQTAVKFLQNPKVLSSPLYQKRAFLEKKGLTQEEIRLAVERSGVKETNADIVPSQPPVAFQPGAMAAAHTGQPVYAPLPPQSMWAKARDLTMTTVIVAGVSYALYQLFEKYLRPLLWGRSIQDKRMEKMERQILDIQKTVADSMAEMSRTLSAIQSSLQTQQPTSSYSAVNSERALTDLKSDIASLKGLLLNRSQFPPAPPTSMMLPSWQRASASTTSSPGVSKFATAATGQPEPSINKAHEDSLAHTDSPSQSLETVSQVTEVSGHVTVSGTTPESHSQLDEPSSVRRGQEGQVVELSDVSQGPTDSGESSEKEFSSDSVIMADRDDSQPDSSVLSSTGDSETVQLQ